MAIPAKAEVDVAMMVLRVERRRWRKAESVVGGNADEHLWGWGGGVGWETGTE